jgi:hypothetical protein
MTMVSSSAAGLRRDTGMSEELIRKMDDGFARMDARFEQIDARFAQVDARFGQIDVRFGQIDIRLGRLEDVTHKQGILLEKNTVDIQFLAEKIGTIEASVDRRLTEFESKLDNRLIPLEQIVREHSRLLSGK